MRRPVEHVQVCLFNFPPDSIFVFTGIVNVMLLVKFLALTSIWYQKLTVS